MDGANYLLKSKNKIDNIINISAKQSVAEKSSVDGCDKCDKKGLVFLPVRYAVGEIKDLKKYSLPESRVKEFTDIYLNESVNKNGQKKERPAKNCYILRKLRKGYLYIYDNHPKLPLWVCYGVNDNGELISFPAASPKPLDDLKPMDNCTKGDGHPARASLVSLRDPSVNRTIHIMFLEVALDITRLEWIASNPEWRDKNMQALEVSSPQNSPYYFSRSEIPKFVPEYDDSRDPYTLLKYQMWQGRYANKVTGDIARRLRMDTCDVLWEQMDAIRCTNGGVDGFMLAIKDEVGIVEQLDAQRVYPTAVLQRDMLPGDTKDPLQPSNKTLNERNYKWYLAVQQFQEIMQSMKIRDEEIDENYIAPGQKQTYKQVLEELEERKKEIPDVINRYTRMYHNYESLSEEDKQKVVKNKEEDYYNYLARKKRSYEREWAVCRRTEISKRDSAVKEVGDYYNGNDWNCIDSVVGEYVERIKKDTPIFDDDYSLWVISHLNSAIMRYDESSFMHCGHVASIISDALQHGVLSPASYWMWNTLQNFNDEGKILLRGFTFNMPSVFSEISESLAPAQGKDKLEEIKSIIKGSKKCYGKFKKAYDKAKSDSLKKAFWDKGDIQIYFESFKKLTQVNINVTAISWLSDAAHNLAQEDAFANRYSVNFNSEKRLYALNEAARSVSDVLSEKEPSTIRVAKYTITLGELSKLGDAVNVALVGVPDDVARPIAQHYSHLNSVGANFANVDISNNINVDVFVVGDSVTINNLDASYAKRLSATNSVIDFHDKHQQAFVELFKNPKKSFDTITGKVAVITACINATKSVMKNSTDMDAWCKCITSWLGVFQLVVDVTSWRYTRLARMEFVKAGADVGKKLFSDTKIRDFLKQKGEGLSEEAVKRVGRYVVNTEVCILASKGLTHLMTLASFYDAWKGYLQVADMKRKGALRRDIVALSAKVIIDLVSSIVIGLCVTSFFIGAFLGLLIFGITSLFIKKRLVPECIQGWIRRSKFGKERETVLGRPFKDMNEEQESLRLLLKGVVVSATVDNGKLERARATAVCELDSAKAFEYNKCKVTGVNKDISLDISIPYGMAGMVEIIFSIDEKSLKLENDYTVLFLKDGTENNAAAFWQEKNEGERKSNEEKDPSELANGEESKKIYLLNKSGKVIGDNFIFEGSNGVDTIWNIATLGIDNTVAFKKTEDRLNLSIFRHLFIDENVRKSTGKAEAELGINVTINANGQVFSEIFRSKLPFPE